MWSLFCGSRASVATAESPPCNDPAFPAQLSGMGKTPTVWGLTDTLSWTPWYYKIPDWPLLFDANFQRKAAWNGMSEALKATP